MINITIWILKFGHVYVLFIYLNAPEFYHMNVAYLFILSFLLYLTDS